uniref:Serpin domain-containing protein n=1 Tax=Echeneis naucrates TaxID=173247 RepID=A0A665W1T3_ECHNA
MRKRQENRRSSYTAYSDQLSFGTNFQLRKSHSLESLLRNSGVSSVFSHSTFENWPIFFSPLKSDIILDFSIPQRITFDRPFMLIIYDEVTGLVLIMGRVIDPIDV